MKQKGKLDEGLAKNIIGIVQHNQLPIVHRVPLKFVKSTTRYHSWQESVKLAELS